MAGDGDNTQRDATVPLPDSGALRELLGLMKASLATIGQTFQTFNEQSAQVSKLGPSMNDAATHLQTLRNEIKAHDKKQDSRIEKVKNTIKNDIKDQVAREMHMRIQEQLKKEVESQVKEKLDIQILEHLPMPLQQQVEESKMQVTEVKNALGNSEARRVNSALLTNLDDSLAVVLKPDGTKSNFYPANLKSLFSYDLTAVRALLQDYGLPECKVREQGLNRFMSHIGVPLELVTIPAADTTLISPIDIQRRG